MPEDLKHVADRLFSAAASIQGTSLSRSKKTLSNYLCLLFPEIVYYDRFVYLPLVVCLLGCLECSDQQLTDCRISNKAVTGYCQRKEVN